MKSNVLILLILFLCFTAVAQQKGNEVRTYSGCEDEHCNSSYTVRFKHDSTVWISSRLHQYSSNFIHAGKWKSTENGIVIQIKEYKKKTRLTDLGGTYYKVAKPEFEFLIKETSIADTTEIFEAAAKHLKSEMGDWQMDEKAESTRKFKSKILSSFIRHNFSWKSSLLILDVDR